MDKRSPGTSPREKTTIKTAYGIDLSTKVPTVIRAVRKGSRVEFQPAAVADVQAHDGADDTVASSAGLNARACITRWVTTPLESRSKAMRVFPALLDIQLPFPLEECRFEFVHVSADLVGGTRALAVAARDSSIDALLKALKEHELSPMVLDSDALAIWGEARIQWPDLTASEPVAIVHTGETESSLILAYRGDFRSAHTIAKADEPSIRRVLEAQSDHELKDFHWILIGEDARVTAAREALTNSGDVQASHITVPDNTGHFLATAIARRAILPSEDFVNLRSGPLTHRTVVSTERKYEKKNLYAFAMAGIILCLVNIIWLLATGWKANSTRTEFHQRAEVIAGSPLNGAMGEDALRKAKALFKQRDSLGTHLERALSPTLASSLEAILQDASKNGIRIQNIRLSDHAIHLTGSSADWDAIESYTGKIKTLGYAASFERPEKSSGDRVPFTIKTEVAP